MSLLDVQEIEVPYDINHSIECPLCFASVRFKAVVRLEPKEVSNGGSEGFHKPLFRTNIKEQVVGMKMHHECTKEPKK